MICLWVGNSPIGKSLCEVYSNIIELTLTRWLVKTDSGHNCKCKPSEEYAIINFKCMNDNTHCRRYMPLLLKIGHLAFSTLFNIIQEKSLLFDRREVLKYLSEEELKQCLDTGLLSQVKDTTSLTEKRMQLYFPHKTLHEFFCALCIATNWNNTDTETNSIKVTLSNKCTSISDILEMSEVFMFVSGLNPEVYSDISRQLAPTVDNDHNVTDYRNCVGEHMYGFGNILPLEHYQSMQISCFLECSKNQHPECNIVIKDIFVYLRRYDEMVEDEKRALEKILLNSASSIYSLKLADFDETKNLLSGLPGILEKTECPCLESLSVGYCKQTLFQSVLTSKAHTLKYILLKDVSLSDGMFSSMSKLNNLRGLYLYCVYVSSDGLNAVSDCITDCMMLQKLALDLRYESSGREKPEQCEAVMNFLLRSVEAKKMLTCLELTCYVVHQNYVLDLSKHDKLQDLYVELPLSELHINTENLVECKVDRMHEFSAHAVSSLLAELHGAPVLETLSFEYIRNTPPRIDITSLPGLTKFILRHCDLRDSIVTLTLPGLTTFTLSDSDLRHSTVTLTLPRLTKFTLRHCDLGDSTVTLELPGLRGHTLVGCDLRDSTVTLVPEMASLETIRLRGTTVSISSWRELFLCISKLPHTITIIMCYIRMTVGEWRELLFDILGKLSRSIHVEMNSGEGPSWEEWRNIFDNMESSPAFYVKRNYLIYDQAYTEFDTVVA